ARMPRKSSFSAPATVIKSQFLPPSVVCMTVPSLPLAQITFLLSTLRPRKLEVVAPFTRSHCAFAAIATNKIKEEHSFITAPLPADSHPLFVTLAARDDSCPVNNLIFKRL